MATSDNFPVEATISATVSDNDTPTMTTMTPPNTSDDGAQHRASGETKVMTTMMMMMGQRMELREEGEQRESKRQKIDKDSSSERDVKVSSSCSSSSSTFIRFPRLRREDSQTGKIVASSESDEGEPRTPEIVTDEKENVDKDSKRGSLLFMKVPKLKREKSNSETLERKKKRVKFSATDDEDDVMVDTRVFEPVVVSGCERFDGEADGDISCKIKKLLKRRPKKKKSTIETQTEDEEKERKEQERLQRITSDKETCLEISDKNVLPSSDNLTRLVDKKTINDDVDSCFHDPSSPEDDKYNKWDSLKTSASASENVSCAKEHSSGTCGNSASRDVIQEAKVPVEVPCSTIQSTKVEINSNLTNELTQDQTHSLQATVNKESYPEKATLQEEQELEITSCDIKERTQNTAGTLNEDLSAPFEDDPTSMASQGSVKREGTFTLDGPPPAKITRSSCDVSEDTLPHGNTPPRESIMEPLHFFIDINQSSEVEGDSSTAKKDESESQPSKALPSKSVRIKDPPEKKPEEQTSTVKALKNSARRTFACAWRTATKPPEDQNKSPKPQSKPQLARPKTPPVKAETTVKATSTKSETVQRSSPTKLDTVARSSPTKDRNTKTSLQRKPSDPTPKGVTSEKPSESKSPKESLRLSRPIKRTFHQHPDSPRTPTERTSVWAGVSLPSFRREGTFTKKYDSERDRLQAECNRLNVEKERLQSELYESRTRLEDEVTARKALKRNHELSLRQLRDAEIKRSELLMADLRNRLEDERREALALQKDTLMRTHESDLMKADREKDEDHRRILHEARLTEERLKAEIRRETARMEQQPVKQCCHTCDRDVDRLNRDLSTLREYKKRLEDVVQTLQDTDRKRAGELRRLHEEHEAAVAKIHKINKTEAARLLDELRSKERTINQLEKQVSAQSAKLRLQEEKQRELSNERIEEARKQNLTRSGGSSVSCSKKQKEGANTKDGRHKEKEICNNVSTSPASITSILPTVAIIRRSSSIEVEHISPMEQSVESGISLAMTAETEDLKQQLEQQRQHWEEKQQQWEEQLHQWQEKQQQWENQKQQWEDQHQQLEIQRQEWDEQKQQLAKKLEEQQEMMEAERERLQNEIELNLLKVDEQKQVMEAQRLVMDEQKEVLHEQQMRIADLTEEAMDRECMVFSSQQHIWPPRRESCVKVCELPTVLEQSSDEELSPISSPTTPDPSPLHCFDPYDRDLDQPPSPTPFLTPTTPGNEPLLWPQVDENELNHQYAQLSREHHELQKSYQLLLSTSTASSPSIDLGNKDGPSEWWSVARVMELESLTSTLKAELQEARDHADLLEFRVLELTEGSDRLSEPDTSVQTCDQSTSTDFDDVTIPVTSEDLSLPLSIDSGLDISNDYKARVTEGRSWLAQLAKNSGDPECAAAQHLTALLDWVANTLPAHASTHHGLTSPMSPTLATPAPNPKTGMGGDEIGGDLGRDLMLLATRLQESLNDPTAQEPVLLDTISKLRALDTSLTQLQDRVVSLTEENRELQEAVTTLSDAHETRTEASGTESELVHRKTPSIHSDLSDAESDSPEHAQQHRPVKLVTLDASTSFQESGIFDTTCELVHVTTQTDVTQVTVGTSSKHETDLRKPECELREAEIDLQSAVARLAAIRSAVQGRDLRHLRLQDLQESDEYLRTCLDERIILSKLEYDGIVEGERCLQQELEHLKCEKDQLSIDCEALKEQIRTYKASRGTDAEETLKGEIRVLQQKLMVTERARQEVFEEKCELEEEENDCRLMVQRLESQMEAAREMENLLSASLSQEQEISRELHRRVRDLQILEKDHRVRLEKLECVSRQAEEKAVALAAARDALAMQLSFATYGIMLADAWRYMVPNPNGALVPYSGKALIVSPESCPTYTSPLGGDALDSREAAPAKTHCDKCVCTPVMCDVFVQADFELPVVSAGVQTEVEANCVGIQCCEEPENVVSAIEYAQRRSAEKNEDDEPLLKRFRSTKSQSTMTLTPDTPTEREQYYLEQIEALQREKINLRKGHETDRRDSLQQHSDLEGEMEVMRQELEEAQHDKCSLIFRLEEAQDQRDDIKQKYIQRIEELKGDISRYKDMYEQEKRILCRDYDSRIKEVEKERDLQEDRVRQLELQLSNFRQELEIVGVSIASDMVEFDTDVETVLSQGKSSMKRTDDGELVKKIRELVKAESTLRQKIQDLEKKECAYRETIREADKIMSSHVTSYKQRIEELEATTEQQVSRIQQLEASEERLRASLRNNSRTSEGARISDLLDRLIETENSELKLKERVWTLERSEKELQIKLMEEEKNNQSLRGELRDQEELVHRLRALETENNALAVELGQAQESARKMSEVQQSESFLRGRVEELEVTENMLRETLHQADLILAQRERKLRDQLSSLQEEVQAYKAQLEAAASKEYGARESEVSYRKQLEELKSRLADTERELKESSSETMSHETQHRSEVTKLRNQLKLSNSQLTELDRLNCELRDRVLSAEAEGQRLAKELEEHGRRHEQDLISFNLQISSRDSRIEEMEHQLEQMTHVHAASELDALAASPIASLHSSITTLTTALKSCESCKETQSGTLTEVTTQLGTLAELLEGQSNSDIEDFVSDTDEEEPHEAENLAHEATSTPPPNPLGEGPREHSSGDVVSCTASGRLKRDFRRRSRRRLEERNTSRRLVRPQGSSTILEELEEKVRELEEAVGRKEEELRLADSENCELNSQLQNKDEALSQKGKEIDYLNSTLASLRQQLMHTMEDYERSKLSLQAKHKVDLEELTKRVEQFTKEAERLASRGKLKDTIISTLANQIRAILRSGNMSVVINQLRRLQDVNAVDQVSSGNESLTDFDVEAVCSFLNQPSEDMNY